MQIRPPQCFLYFLHQCVVFDTCLYYFLFFAVEVRVSFNYHFYQERAFHK